MVKITIDVDCTPEEARTFLGLPNVTPINDAMVEQMKRRVEEGFKPEELDAMMRAWTQSATSGMGEIQKQFWGLMNQAAQPGKK